MLVRVFRFFILIGLIAGCGTETKHGFTQNGERYIAETRNDIFHGVCSIYYNSGNLKSVGIYSNGLLQGLYRSFYDTSISIVQSISKMQNGENIDTTFYYSIDGWVKDYWVFNKNGDLTDCKIFYKKDSQDLDLNLLKVLMYPPKDTILVGEDYVVYATLGNREYNSVEGVLGDIVNKRYLLNNPKLPKANAVTVIIRISSDSIKKGENYFSGALVNLDSSIRDPLKVVCFEKSFYVK
jgi:antitoxin component YwqK of YwqJK toxin-antitoxin module